MLDAGSTLRRKPVQLVEVPAEDELYAAKRPGLVAPDAADGCIQPVEKNYCNPTMDCQGQKHS